MCNACGFLCCASDEFSGCGCNDCECEACWTDTDEGCDECKVIDVSDELHQILADALKQYSK